MIPPFFFVLDALVILGFCTNVSNYSILMKNSIEILLEIVLKMHNFIDHFNYIYIFYKL